MTQRVQEVFNRFNVNLEVTEKTRTEMAEATLENGSVIYTDAEAFAEGVEAFIINDEGERIMLPAGDYTFQDGTTIVVGEGGVIESVTAPEAPAEAPAEEPAPVAELAEEKEEKEKEEEKMNYVTREEVEEMVMNAIEKFMNPEDEKKEEEKEKMGEQVNLSAQLESIKAELEAIKKTAVSGGLKHKAPAVKPEPVDFSKLNIQERVKAIHNQFSK